MKLTSGWQLDGSISKFLYLFSIPNRKGRKETDFTFTARVNLTASNLLKIVFI